MTAKQMAMGVYHRAVSDHWENDPRARLAAHAVKVIASNVAAWNRDRAKARARQRSGEYARTFNTVGQAMGKARQ